MKKLLIIGPRAFPADFVGTSGVESYVEHTLRELLLVRKDLHVTLFTRKKYQQEIKNKVTLKNVEIKTLWSYPGRVLEAVSYSFLASVRASFQDADVVWCHTAGMSLFSWLPALFGKEVWITIHSLDWQRRKWHKSERLVFKSAFRAVMKLVPNIKLFAVSEILCQRIQTLTQKSCTVIHPGLPTPPKQMKKSAIGKYLLYLGRLVPEKRTEWLLEFCQSRKIPCVIAGTHGNTPEYESMLRKKYTSPYVQWYGAAVGLQKWKLLTEARCLVLPSELEGFPITILEAISVKKPSLLAQRILPKEIENLSMIHTFSTSSQKDFDKKLDSLWRKKSQKFSLSGRDRRTLANYSWKRTAKAYFAFL
jgi:glycosyltransferase involved in cell wall biosynthesis